jgi:O-antigen/teichoic acid export membrane protein
VKSTLRKLAELTLTHVATFAFPFAFAVLCGRVLGVHDYGIVSFYTALAAFLGVIIEFGFDWLGIREVAQAAGDLARRHLVLANVTAAKLLICAITCAVSGPALFVLRGPDQIALIAATMVYMAGFAMDVSWYLRALERMRLLLVITVVTRLAGLALLWTIVSRPGDMVPALWSYTFVAMANAAIGWGVVVHQGLAGRVRPQRRIVGGLMQRAWAIVFGNLGSSLLTNGGVALLGLIAAPATVGAANLALRIKMAGQAALLPIKQLSYVRLSALAHSPADRDRALRVGRIVLMALLSMGTALCIAIVFSAEWIVRQVFRGDYPTAVGLIMLLGLSVPINAVAELFGMQCLIAFGRERSYAAVVSVAALVFCGLLLFTLHGDLAYGWALLAAEASLAAMAGLRLRAVLQRST